MKASAEKDNNEEKIAATEIKVKYTPDQSPSKSKPKNK